jgi:hypothetical protein
MIYGSETMPSLFSIRSFAAMRWALAERVFAGPWLRTHPGLIVAAAIFAARQTSGSGAANRSSLPAAAAVACPTDPPRSRSRPIAGQGEAPATGAARYDEV